MPKKNNSPAIIPACHPDRKHLARGLCKPCYDTDYQSRKREECNKRKRVWGAKNPLRVRAIHRRYLYRIEPEQFQARLNAQDGMCKICQVRPAVHLDHNHDTNSPRGILCGDCNRALGLFRENKNFLANAIKYLELWDDHCVQVIKNTGKRADGKE